LPRPNRRWKREGEIFTDWWFTTPLGFLYEMDDRFSAPPEVEYTVSTFRSGLPMPTPPKDRNFYLTVIGTLVGVFSLWVSYRAYRTSIEPQQEAKRNRTRLLKGIGVQGFDADIIERATRYFIRTSCTNVDPGKEAEIRHALTATREDLFQVTDRFIEEDTPIHHMLVLADSGTGKTTFALNYYAYNESKPARKRHQIAVVPLGHPDVDGLIQKILDAENEFPAENTNLFLDALDEDTNAIEDHIGRLQELMEKCRDFRRVIITCRTQFFKRDEEIPPDTGIVRFGPRRAGQKAVYEFRKIYIAPFDDDDIQRYIARRYPFWKFSTRQKALDTALKIPMLSVRPMLLAHIPDLIDDGKNVQHVTELYEIMIEAWLERESDWIPKETLLDFSEQVAIDIFAKREERDMERIPYEELCELIAECGLNEPNWKFTGRSLLNRDAGGNFKFAHRSIMEFLFVQRFVQLPVDQRPILEWTQQMREFLLQLMERKPVVTQLQRVDLKDVILSRIDWIGRNFSTAQFSDNPIGIEFLWIPPGTFLREGREVTLTEGYLFQTTPVTQKQWESVMGKNPSRFRESGPEVPVEQVSWEDAQNFIKKLNQSEKINLFRLPTEAEWEYACRAGTQTEFFFGDDPAELKEHGWHKENSGSKTHPIGQLKPNPWGLFDMHGNVWEWCWDWYGEYPDGKVTDPTGPELGKARVARGGSWINLARDCRSASRNWYGPVNRHYFLGFRLVRIPGR
jgi:formylglycine-generating enzyme required for sulfatase activity